VLIRLDDLRGPEIVALLEDTSCLVECCEDTTVCERADLCPTRLLWKEASEAMFDRLEAITLADMVERAKAMESKESTRVLASS